MAEKRIAFFTNRFPGVINTFFSRDLTTLLHHGFKVDVFTTYPIQDKYWANVPDNLRDKIKTDTNVYYLNPVHVFWKNIPAEIIQDIRVILRQSWNYSYVHFFKSLSVIQQAISWRNKFDGQYDYMLAYWGNYVGTYAYLANRLSKSEVPFSFFLRAGTDLYRDQIFLEQKILYAKTIFLPCIFNRDFLNKLYPLTFCSFEEKLFFHYHGLEINNFKFIIHQRDQNSILVIGSLISQKGFRYAIKAISLLKSEFPELKIIIIGDGPEKRSLMRLANSLGIENQVKFTGWLLFEEVKAYLEKSTILVHPSSDLGDAEPNVIKEAMASGLPVIGADIVGIPEILDYGNVGILFPPKDHVALANSIRKLLNEPGYREEMAQKARKFAEEKYDMRKNGIFLSQQIENDMQDY